MKETNEITIKQKLKNLKHNLAWAGYLGNKKAIEKLEKEISKLERQLKMEDKK